MTPPHTIAGTVLRLRCQACAAVFPHFQFSSERDTDAAGLYSASSGTTNEVFIAEAEAAEWKDFDRAGATLAERRLYREQGRNDLRVIRLLRIESALTGGQGMSLAQFKAAYRPAVLVYSRACCDKGESRTQETLSCEAFRQAGGHIRLGEGLALE